MKLFKMILYTAGVAALSACAHKQSEFKYTIDQFADIKIMRYQIPGWDNLSLQQKQYAFHLSEAAKLGRDITWDQYCKYNLPVRHALEDILHNYSGERSGAEWDNFLVYAKGFSSATASIIITPKISFSLNAAENILPACLPMRQMTAR